uniref:Uncharacterized protein n=1 Tax=Anguilla anguilla TaxID=7936 RepID=A0A0E9S5G8_ANGAN
MFKCCFFFSKPVKQVTLLLIGWDASYPGFYGWAL